MEDMCCNGQLTVLAGRWDNGFEHTVREYMIQCINVVVNLQIET